MRIPRNPAKLKTALLNLGADTAGDVIAALTPIETGPAENSLASKFRYQAEPEGRKEVRAGIGQLATVLREDDVSFGNKRIGNSYSQFTAKWS